MNKTDLGNAMAAKMDTSNKDGKKAVDAFIECVTEALAQGKNVSLIGFGNFTVKERAARVGRNPKTNEEIEIPKTTVPAFKAGQALKDAVK
jgi:DNA-binding protein HU-beta